MTRDFLENRAGPIKIHTRSDLIGHDDYVSRLNPKDEIFIHIPSSNEAIVRALEPGAPSLRRRLDAFDKLRDGGFNVKLVHDKIPLTEKIKNKLGDVSDDDWEWMNSVDLKTIHGRGIPVINKIK